MAGKTREQWIAVRRARWGEAIELVERGEAPQRVCECVALVAEEGLGTREIADRLQVSTSMVGQYLNDPTGTKTAARKAKGQRPCVDCGEPCNTDGSISEPSERCGGCARARASSEAKWQPDAIIAAIRRWAAEHDGLPPKAQGWGSGQYSHPDYWTGAWPAWNTVAYRFGSFNAAVEAAGFTPHRRLGGQPRKPLTRQQLADTAALVEEHGLDQAAQILGMTKAGVKRRLNVHAGRPTGGQMSRALTAETIIDRELTKVEAQAAKFREELAHAEEQARRLKIAQRALTNGSAAVPSAA